MSLNFLQLKQDKSEVRYWFKRSQRKTVHKIYSPGPRVHRTEISFYLRLRIKLQDSHEVCLPYLSNSALFKPNINIAQQWSFLYIFYNFIDLFLFSAVLCTQQHSETINQKRLIQNSSARVLTRTWRKHIITLHLPTSVSILKRLHFMAGRNLYALSDRQSLSSSKVHNKKWWNSF